MSWRRALPVIALTFLGFALSLRIFYPGVMTYDARYVHAYIANPPAGDWQSPLMTALWAVIDPLAPGAPSMFLFIAVLYWLSFAALALALARRSAWLGPVTVLLALTPSCFVFVGVIWRDIMLASSWLLAAALAYAVADRRGSWRIAAQALAWRSSASASCCGRTRCSRRRSSPPTWSGPSASTSSAPPFSTCRP